MPCRKAAFSLLWVLLLFSCMSRPALAAPDPVGRLVSVQGQVRLRPAGAAAWSAAQAGRTLFPGDALATGPAAKAAVLCVDESQIKLNENTVLVLKASAVSARLAGGGLVPAKAVQGRASLYDVPKGEVWLKNEAERFRFEMTTPALTAAIRGTEFVVRVAGDGTSSVALLGGSLTVFNPKGELRLAAGEIASARPGEAPTKQVLVNPQHAVQWTLYYPAVADPNLLLAGAPSGPAATAVGRALAEAGEGDVAGAYRQVGAVMARGAPPAPGVAAGAAYVALMAGEPAVAGKWLEAALVADPGSVPAGCLDAQMALFQNRRAEAAARAGAVLAAAPEAPLAQVTAGLVAMSAFDLPRAKALFRRALARDAGFVAASVYLARIELGSDELEAAWRTMRAALAAAPKEALVQATAGFVRLGFRDFTGAEEYFTRAAALDPGLGDARLGLGYVAYARGKKALGLEEMLTATLLAPRLSLLQSTLGKALYQNRDFEKALATYDYAASLDPADPTPHLYKGIALTDLNRPGEAIREINDSIAKNGNRALFRSRLTLDRDLAVRNVDLARSYTLLGLGDWAYSKAVTAVKNDPLNPSAHLFMSSAYMATRQRTGASGTELLLFRLLSPANQNSFTLYNDYTPMFEMPYLRAQAIGTVGFWSNGNTQWSSSLDVYGGRPGVAAEVYGAYSDDVGMRRQNGYTRSLFGSGQVKWEPVVRDSILVSATLSDSDTGDNSNLNDWLHPNSTHYKQSFSNRAGELGFVHRFGPTATFIGYAAAANNVWAFRNGTYSLQQLYEDDSPLVETYWQNRHTTRHFLSLQAQQQLVLGRHTLLFGGDYFSGELDYRYKSRDRYVYWGYLLADDYVNRHYNPPDRTGSGYVMDYWKLAPGVVAELGLGYDVADTSRHGWPDSIHREALSPRVGLNWQLSASQTIRLAFQRYLNTHTFFQSVIAPSEVAGFPGRLNADDGSTVTELGGGWEVQWDDRTFTVARLSYHEVLNPQYDPFASYDRIFDVTISRYMATLGLNRILTPSLGLSVFGVAKRLLPHESTARRYPESDFFEADGVLALNYLHASGLGCGISGTLVHQHYFDNRYLNVKGEHRTETLFGLLDAKISYEFPGKHGFVAVEGKNLTNTRFTYQREAVALDAFYPDRQIVFKLGWYF